LSFDDIATPMSPPSSKKKRDGSLGIGTWPSPPNHDMKDDMVSYSGHFACLNSS
jgi:hypothetical protein